MTTDDNETVERLAREILGWHPKERDEASLAEWKQWHRAVDKARAILNGPTIRELQAEVWDEGHDAGWNSRHDDALSGWMPSGTHESDAENPYRSPQATTEAGES